MEFPNPMEHTRRPFKKDASKRSVPLWPQLREVLVPYVAALADQSPDALLFPSVRGTGMIVDIRKALDAAAARVGWDAGEVRTKMFRHTYCAARLQNANRIVRRDHATGKLKARWIDVSRDEVSRKVGHGGTALGAKVYGHVGDAKHRSEQPEFFVQNHMEKLGPRLRLIQAA